MREVKKGKKEADPTLVQLSFQTTDAKKTIVSASVTAHGVAPMSEFMLVDQKVDESRTQAFELKSVGTEGLVQREVDVTACRLCAGWS
jgi:hypothetical protein